MGRPRVAAAEALSLCACLHTAEVVHAVWYMVQIENEYGYYGGDKSYLRFLQRLVRQHMGPQVSPRAGLPAQHVWQSVQGCL